MGKKVKQKSSTKLQEVKPFNLFISESGGMGKLQLIKTIHQSVRTNLLQYHGGSPEKPQVVFS